MKENLTAIPCKFQNHTKCTNKESCIFKTLDKTCKPKINQIETQIKDIIINDINNRQPSYIKSDEIVNTIVENMQKYLNKKIDLNNNDTDIEIFENILNLIGNETNYISLKPDTGAYIKKSLDTLYAFVKKEFDQIQDNELEYEIEVENHTYIKLIYVFYDITDNEKFFYNYTKKEITNKKRTQLWYMYQKDIP